MLFGFLPLATLGGWFPMQISFYLYVIFEFSFVYLIVWAVSYYLNKKKVDDINRQLQGKAWGIQKNDFYFLVIQEDEKLSAVRKVPETTVFQALGIIETLGSIRIEHRLRIVSKR